jgi:DNA-binding MarR family transcriptional regulator
MQGVEHNSHKKLTLLELVLQVEGDIRRRLEPIRVTPLHAGVLLFLRRHTVARVTDTAEALGVRLSTLSGMVTTTLARKRWVIKRRSVTDTRVVHVLLSRQGEVLARKIEDMVRL